MNLSEGYPVDPSVKQYGTDVAHHKATISDLKENTEYTYVVGSEKDGWSEEYTFNTGTYGDSWNFLFFGDPQLYNTHDLDQEAAAWDATVTEGVSKNPNTSFLLSAGDQANHSALVEHSKFIAPEEMRSHRVAVNNGNHDNYFKPSYDAMYNRPTQGDENYWFTYNNALIVSLDSNDWKDFDDDAAFVRETIKQHGADKDWVIVTFHHSLFSQAYHQEDRQIMYWRERMTPVFSEMDVDLVLSGHDHIYTRTYLMEDQKPVDFGNPVTNGGTVEKKKGQVQYVTANSSSGSKYYQFFNFKTGERNEDDKSWNMENSTRDKTARTYTAFWNQNEVPDYTNVEVTAQGLKISTFDMQEGQLESFTLKRASDDKADAKGSADSSKKDQNKGSSNPAGIAFGVLAALLTIIGGGFFASQQGILPKQITDMLPF
nr:Exopolysaccharide biosynthesis protein related to N-acetylglucosamine-1-phosphodiester alpha-N-acetylglucosaminidase [Streptococcus thermophilus]